jgi:hypothetical protein
MSDFEIKPTEQELVGSEHLATAHRKLQEQIPRGTTEQTYIQLAGREDISPRAMLETTFPDWKFATPLDNGRDTKLVLLQFCPPRNKLGAFILGKGPRKIGRGNIILAAKTAEDTAVPLYEFSDTDDTIHDINGAPITQDEATALRQLVESADDSMISCIHMELEAAKTEYSRREIRSRLKVLHELTPQDGLSCMREPYVRARTHLRVAWHALEVAAGLSTATKIRDSDDSNNIKEVCEKFMQAPYGTLDLSKELSETMYAIPLDNHPSFGGKVLGKLIRVTELTKEFEDANRDPRYPHIAFMQQTNVQQKITSALAER